MTRLLVIAHGATSWEDAIDGSLRLARDADVVVAVPNGGARPRVLKDRYGAVREINRAELRRLRGEAERVVEV